MMHKEIYVFILNNKNQILLQKRSKNKRHYPNMWALCTGHVEENETFEKPALRELKEELGINVKKLYSFANSKFDIYKDNAITKYYYVKCDFKARDFVIQKTELSQVKWYDIEEIISMIKCNNETIVYKENRLNLFQFLQNNRK